MNDLSITIVDGEMQTFQLIDYPKCKKNKDEASYLFEARDRKTRDHWGTLIQGRLWAQLEKFKGQLKKIFTYTLIKLNKIYFLMFYRPK